MEWFGITLYGFPDSFKDLMRPDYKEPAVQPTIGELLEQGKNHKLSFSEIVTELDCYIGHADGYAYRSYDRLVKMRKKGILKPVGPSDMYNYPGTDAMKFGWWKKDPKIIGETWYKQPHYPAATSEMSRYFNKALQTDKFFRL